MRSRHADAVRRRRSGLRTRRRTAVGVGGEVSMPVRGQDSLFDYFYLAFASSGTVHCNY